MNITTALLDPHFTDAPICPHCGSTMSDAWELEFGMSGTEEVDCGHCGQPYLVTQHVRITYSTKAINND